MLKADSYMVSNLKCRSFNNNGEAGSNRLPNIFLETILKQKMWNEGSYLCGLNCGVSMAS